MKTQEEIYSEVLDFDQCRQYLKTSEPTLRRLLRQGKIPGFKVGSTWRFRLADLRRLGMHGNDRGNQP